MNKNNGSSAGFWIIMALLFAFGAWPIAVPIVLLKLFGRDKSSSERREAPPLNPGVTAANRTSTSRFAQQARSTSSNYYNNYSNYNTKQANAPTQTAQPSKVAQAARTVTETPKPSENGHTWLAIGGAVLLLLGLLWTLKISSVWSFMSAFGMLAGGASMVAGSVFLNRAEKRYNKYKAVIGSSKAVEIGAIAKKMGLSEKKVIKDLNNMIDKGYFGDSAYINMELGFLLLSSDADTELNKYRDEALKKAAAAKKAESADQLAEGYQKVINQIRDVNDRIAHKEMSEKIYKIEDITRRIFTVVQNDPSKVGKLDNFLSYYLPTTLKLLESYAELEKTGLDSGNVQQSKASIENAMDSIVHGFENQFDELYKADVLDIETDIDVMTRMLKNDSGTAAEDFKITVDASTPQDSHSQFEKDFGLKHENGGFVSLGGSAAAQAEEEK